MILNNRNFNKWAKSICDDPETLAQLLDNPLDDESGIREDFADTFRISYDEAQSKCSVGALSLTLGDKYLGINGWE